MMSTWKHSEETGWTCSGTNLNAPVLLLNTTICSGLPTEGNAAVYRITGPVTAEDARALLAACTIDSAIGHDATAHAMAALIGQPVAVNRQLARQRPGQRALVLKIRGRIPEGTVLDRDAMEEIGYDLFWMDRIE